MLFWKSWMGNWLSCFWTNDTWRINALSTPVKEFKCVRDWLNWIRFVCKRSKYSGKWKEPSTKPKRGQRSCCCCLSVLVAAAAATAVDVAVRVATIDAVAGRAQKEWEGERERGKAAKNNWRSRQRGASSVRLLCYTVSVAVAVVVAVSVAVAVSVCAESITSHANKRATRGVWGMSRVESLFAACGKSQLLE